ncbi:MAG TPA: hypothetical protein VEB66_11885 [Opitutaceae bacterium]|nr:hypothetical protein [Opitutaceae bacterium]
MNAPHPSHPLHERHERLWRLAISPVIWGAHLMASYATAAVWCARHTRDGSLGPVRWAIAAYTVAALAGIAWNGLGGLRRHRRGTESPPHDFDTPGDRHGFLGYATVLLAGLSAVAVLFAALVIVFFKDCR